MKTLRILARVRRAMSKQFGREEALRRWMAKDFSGVDFRGANFAEADFRSCDFYCADFAGADFRSCDFYCADFAGADFRMSDFSEADFLRTNFTQANFRGANFRRTNFTQANFRRTNFSWSDFRGVDFRMSDFSGADFRGADFTGANFAGADFAESAGIQWADLSWHGHGAIGRKLLALRLPQGIRYFCGCFSGSEQELRGYIAKKEAHLAPSRLRALEFLKESFT